MKKVFLLVVALLMSTTLFAFGTEDIPESTKGEKGISEILANADEDDWAAYTKAAQLAINWNEDLELAKEWLDHAMSVDRNATNLEVLGDYYMRLGDYVSAFDAYREALQVGMFTLNKEDFNRVQMKLKVNGNYSKAGFANN